MIQPEESPVESAEREGACSADAFFPAHAGRMSLKGRRQSFHGVFYPVDFRMKELIGYPQTECGPPVVIAGNLVVPDQGIPILLRPDPLQNSS